MTGTRRDARRNREELLRVAKEVFSNQGLDAPTSTVARSAGLSSATLYRHFPTRADLTAAVFAKELDACAATLDAAVQDSNPRRGLVTVLETLAEQQVRNPAFADAFLGRVASLPSFNALRGSAHASLAQLVAHAKADGGLREDFTVSDVFALLHATRGLAIMPPDAARAASRRLTSLFIEACFRPTVRSSGAFRPGQI